MLPVIALVGRPNVGKSTLFNRLTKSRDAIVDNQPGVTRDRLYGRGKLGTKAHLVVDSGGVTFADENFDPQIQAQVELLLEEASEIFFIVDGKEGIHPHDEILSKKLRATSAHVTVLVNKSEGVPAPLITADFQQLGLGTPLAISATRGDGVTRLIQEVLDGYDDEGFDEIDHSIPRVALVGRPNAGKSTLTNALVGEERVIVSEIAGTTRDSISIDVHYREQDYVVIDTAGVRRRSKVNETLEKFSVVKTLQAIERANVAVILMDGQEGVTSQDVSIASMVFDMGCALVLAVNKFDGLNQRQKYQIDEFVDLKFPFLPNVEVLKLSAKFGTAVGDVLPAAYRAYKSAFTELSTSKLNKAIEEAVSKRTPPMKGGRPIKIKFAHQAGKNPPVIVLHGNQVDKLPDPYMRYLKSYIAKTYKMVGTPIHLIPRVTANPYLPDPEKKTKNTVNSKRFSKRRQR